MHGNKDQTTVPSTTPSITKKVPLVPFKVLETGIPFFRDKECTQQIPDATLAIIQALDPDDEVQELDIVPTTKTYEKGQYVTLAFDNKKLWEDCYYRDPDGGEILKAWRIHVNFIGEVIEPQAIAAEKSRIDDLERRVQEKIKEIAQRREASIEGEKIN
ncbi:MAG: hypothetical protein P8020_11460 [Acidobacteriota bacterium]